MNELINVTLNKNNEFSSFEELFLWVAREKAKMQLQLTANQKAENFY